MKNTSPQKPTQEDQEILDELDAAIEERELAPSDFVEGVMKKVQENPLFPTEAPKPVVLNSLGKWLTQALNIQVLVPVHAFGSVAILLMAFGTVSAPALVTYYVRRPAIMPVGLPSPAPAVPSLYRTIAEKKYQVRQRVEKYFEEAWQSRDSVKMAAYFAEDADRMTSLGTWTRSKGGIQRAYSTLFVNDPEEDGLDFSKSRHQVEGVKVELISDDVAMADVGTILSEIREKANDEAVQRYLIVTCVLVRRHDQWFIKAMRANAIQENKHKEFLTELEL